MALRPVPTKKRRVFARARPASAATRRVLTFAVAALMSLVGIGAWAGVAAADPEGGTSSLRSQLDEAVRGFLDAQTALEASKARQAQLAANLATAEANFAVGQQKLGEISASAYRSSGFTNIAAVISSGDPSDFLGRVTLLNGLSAHEHAVVNDLINARNEVDSSKSALDAEIAAQTEQLAAMNARKQQAEQALWANGGGQVTGGFNENSEVIAEPAPRNPDGSLPGEGCSVYEPTTGGCITPRTAHARDQAQAAGFGHFVSCYRSYNDGGEHPKGRACDFAAAPGGFGGDAQGDDRTYGNSLAAYFFYNADRLGVLYIIWYRQIWLPTSGWRAYSGCCDSSSMHTNHVHLSMY
jgi:peptidoglycan DL-endopeptidase CwlO